METDSAFFNKSSKLGQLPLNAILRALSWMYREKGGVYVVLVTCAPRNHLVDNTDDE